MTLIYTKEQIDAQATKVGQAIKAAKTAVTQATGQSTTLVPSQKLMTDNIDSLNTRIDVARTHGTYYAVTTALAPNTYIGTDGLLQRSTMLFGTAATKTVGTSAGDLVEAQNITGEINTKIAANVTQVTGQSNALSISQKLFTDTIGDIDAILDKVNGVVV